MNTGDSMYITPFIPHTFATRGDGNPNGLILALTYGGKLTGEPQQELSSLSGLGSEFALDFSSKENSSASLLVFHRDSANFSINELSRVELFFLNFSNTDVPIFLFPLICKNQGYIFQLMNYQEEPQYR